MKKKTSYSYSSHLTQKKTLELGAKKNKKTDKHDTKMLLSLKRFEENEKKQQSILFGVGKKLA